MHPTLCTASVNNVAVTTARDIFEIAPADDRQIVIVGFHVWQTTDFGNAEEEIITLSWIRGNTTSGSGGSALTARNKNAREQAPGPTIEGMNTTQATAGTAVTVWSGGWNIRQPLMVVLTPLQYIQVDQAQSRICLRMLAAPADSITMSASVDFFVVS